MLTHKIRDMFGNSNSGDESRMSSNGGHTSDSQSNHNNNNQQINFAIKLDKSRSPLNYTNGAADDDKMTDGIDEEDEEMVNDDEAKANSVDPKQSNSEEFPFKRDANELKKWCNKLNEMPENIAAS